MDNPAFGRYVALRSELEQVMVELRALHKQQPYVYLRQFDAPSEPLAEENWQAFIEVYDADSQKDGGWALWLVSPDGKTCNRLFGLGDPIAGELFLKLADKAQLLLEQMAMLADDANEVPVGCRCNLQDYQTPTRSPASARRYAWMDLLMDWAFLRPTIGLLTDFTFLDPPEQGAKSEADDEIESLFEFEIPENGGPAYPKNPPSLSLQQSVVDASAELIRLLLAPGNCTRVGHWSIADAPISLPGIGIEAATIAESDTCSPKGPAEPPAAQIPDWNEKTRELKFQGKLLRKLQEKAEHVEAILNAFQTANWENPIDDPLEHGPHELEMAQKRRDAILHLNDSLLDKTLMYFKSDGKGRIAWERGPRPPRRRRPKAD
jgi:hypothetical protein